jgi:hypothetical protein
MDYTTTQYNWSGQPLVVVQRIRKGSTPNPQTHVVATIMNYDELGRVLSIKKDHHLFLNNTNQHFYKPEQTIVQHQYDALGQVKKKKLGSVSSTIDSLTYDYNIRGWALGANRTYAKDTASIANYFGFDLAYDKNNLAISDLAANYDGTQLNGNIAGMLWKSKGDSRVRRYDYTYDAVNRLLIADFKQYATNTKTSTGMPGWISAPGTAMMPMAISYHEARGWTGSASETIDSLSIIIRLLQPA